MLANFTPPVPPSPGTAHTRQISLNKAGFGDGYTQSSLNGINHIRRIVALNWAGLSPDDVAALDQFFADQGGHQPFYYAPWGIDEPLKWTCEEWSSSSGAPWTFTAKLEQSFTLED
ncbi:phage tail protein [Yoonia sp.]|uniref:phage tail protein n=1 Tax=Yoonia sp. TaxID=2212373 RepID=UPI00391B61E7